MSSRRWTPRNRESPEVTKDERSSVDMTLLQYDGVRSRPSCPVAMMTRNVTVVYFGSVELRG